MNHKPWFRFKPTDEELIIDFLIPMVLGLITEVDVPIAEVEYLKHEPWDLPEFSKIKSNDPYWYFFYKLDTGKYLKSKRADRTTEGGYWKATGSDRQVRSRDTKELIGSKKTLVFHEGRVSKKVKGQGINWVIHEYHVTPDVPNPEAYVICCLKKEPKKESKKKAKGRANISIPIEGECSHQSPSDFVNHVAENKILEGTGACLVDPPSQTNPEAVLEFLLEEGLFYQDVSLSNDFSSDPPSQTDMETAMCAQQGQFNQDHPLSNSFSSDILSQADLEDAFFKLSQLLCPQQGPSDVDLPSSKAFNIDPPSEVDLAAVCQNHPLSNAFSNGVQTQFGTINECETYPVAINRGAVGMSSAQPLESISQISDCEYGGMSNDTNKEEAITQARKGTEHVIAIDQPPQLSRNSTQHVATTHQSNSFHHNFLHVAAVDPPPQLSHNSTQHVTTTHLSSQLSHNSTQHVTATHLSPQLSHNSNAFNTEDFNEFVSWALDLDMIP